MFFTVLIQKTFMENDEVNLSRDEVKAGKGKYKAVLQVEFQINAES